MADGDDENPRDELEKLRRRVAELESKLERNRMVLEAVFEHVPANFYVKDIEGRYQYGSRYGFRLFGVDPDRAIGRTDADLFSVALAERFQASDRRVLEGKKMANVSYAIPIQGHPRHFAGVRFPIPGPEGKPIGICGFAVDVTERIELEKELEKLATTDPLTGLGNRRRFDEHFGSEVARAARSGQPLTLVLCDVDHFKRYNDRYGHQRGDECLIAVARAIEGVVRRPADLATRYGGEEFAIVLPDTSEEGAAKLATRLRAAVRNLALEHEGNDAHGIVTVSVGVATVVGSWNGAEIIELADRALYEAKDAGRDRHVGAFDERPPASVGRSVPP